MCIFEGVEITVGLFAPKCTEPGVAILGARLLYHCNVLLEKQSYHVGKKTQ